VYEMSLLYSSYCIPSELRPDYSCIRAHADVRDTMLVSGCLSPASSAV